MMAADLLVVYMEELNKLRAEAERMDYSREGDRAFSEQYHRALKAWLAYAQEASRERYAQ